ncbi:MAG: GNAT family protein [Pseudomonadota bacterium]
MNIWPEDFDYHGVHMRVAPLTMDHLEGLQQASAEGDLHELWVTGIPTPSNMKAEIERRLALRRQGSMLPFTVFDPDGRPCGQTTYMNIDADNKRIEIGSTWYAKRVQRTGVNTECKLALLTNAFETIDCIAVEFRTHFMNHASRNAIERLGAKQDGILRSHMLWNGTLRDTAVYSIIAAEWPTVKLNLQNKLNR